jgi:hypothetical protein
VDNPFFTIDCCYTSFTTFVGATGDNDFIVFTKRNGADLKLALDQLEHEAKSRITGQLKYEGYGRDRYLVLFFEVFGERCTHDLSSFTARSREMSLFVRVRLSVIERVDTFRDFLREEETSEDRLAIAGGVSDAGDVKQLLWSESESPKLLPLVL